MKKPENEPLEQLAAAELRHLELETKERRAKETHELIVTMMVLDMRNLPEDEEL